MILDPQYSQSSETQRALIALGVTGPPRVLCTDGDWIDGYMEAVGDDAEEIGLLTREEAERALGDGPRLILWWGRGRLVLENHEALVPTETQWSGKFRAASTAELPELLKMTPPARPDDTEEGPPC